MVIFNTLTIYFNFQGVAKLSDYVVFKKFPAIPLREIFTAAPNELLDVIGGMLSVNPLNRPTCSEALQMPYFR